MEAREEAGWGAKGRWTAVLVFTLIGFLNFGIVVTARLAEGGAARWRASLVDELTGAWSMLALVPPVLWFLRRFPLGRRTWVRRAPLHAAAFLGFAGGHTLLMWGSRTLAYPLLGLGRFDYGLMRYRFPMEGIKQAAAWGLIFAVEATVAGARRGRERALRAERLERELSEARLAALKAQLQPHFLFNALQMIASWVREDPAVAEEMLARLSDFLRLTLRHSAAQEVPLATELELLDAYLAIMKARFEERLRVDVRVPRELYETRVPQLVLQPIVENALEHCAAVHGRAGHLRVRAERAGERLRLVVEDNGPGLDGADPAAAIGAGVGLSNTAGRLRELYGEEGRIALSETRGGGLTVTLEMPGR